MLDHPIFDVTLGLIFVYVILSLVCSAVQEFVASVAALRSKNLSEGIENLVGSDLAKAVYDHRLVKSLSRPKGLPSYISSETFSTVLLEVVAKDRMQKSYSDLTADELKEMIEGIPEDNPVRDVLSTLVGTAQGEVDALKTKVAGWFDEGMERISGWYKRRVKYWLVAIAAGVTLATNASTLHIVTVLWQDDALRTAIVAQAEAVAEEERPEAIGDAFNEARSLPIGWTGEEALGDPAWWLRSLIGWALTMAAISLGAPFWFDLLGKVAKLRASGGRPERPPQQTA